MDGLLAAIVVLWIVVIALLVAVIALARQVGILFERVAPMGALMTDSGPGVGQPAPRFDLAALDGRPVAVGAPGAKAMLLFFLSPTCPVCKKLLPILKSARSAEASWLDVVLASDGDPPEHRRFIAAAGLASFPYLLSAELGRAFRVSRLPFAALVDRDGTVVAKGLINNREQLESLFNARELGVASVQSYVGQLAATRN